jgi:Rps23 Pro-64 3,4-dihydroxylase Tpa1-like proline 4-hydroxylase
MSSESLIVDDTKIYQETLSATVYESPFPHLIIENFYNEEELELIWEELNFYTKPNKLVSAENYGGVVGYTDAKALMLDSVYVDNESNNGANYRNLSNILTVNRKVFNSSVTETFANIHDCCSLADKSNYDTTKVRYYHDGEGYDPHTDRPFQFLAFSYFYKEPKRFDGGELYFPKYDYEVPCDNNSIIYFPGWVEHGVRKVSIEDSDYFDGYGRYAITSFFGCKSRKT